MRSHPNINSFNGGELSPLLKGRPDLAAYANACQMLENMIPTVQGPARRRGGTRFAAEVKDSATKHWLARFEFSRSQAFILEFGPLFLRFYTSRAQLLSGGTPYQIATPFTAGELTNADGAFGLDLEQSGDVIYITSGARNPYKLSRFGATNWTLTEYVTRNGPLADQNPDKTLRVYASARTGSVTVTASADVFTASHVGALLRIDYENFLVPPWEPAKEIEADGRRRSDGKTYIAMNADGAIITGSKLPIHEEGTVIDGSGVTTETTPRTIGIEWKYEDAGYGVGRITGFTSATQVTVAVHPDTPFPDGVVGSGNASNAWQLGAWGAHAEYPSQVFFWKGRLGFSGRRTAWLSVPREYDNFGRDIAGQVRADAAIALPLESEDANAVTWAAAGEVLLMGTEGTEFLVTKGTQSEPLGPGNVDADPKSTYGSRKVRAIRIADGVCFVQKSGRRVRQARYDNENGTYEAPDLTVLSEHITESGIVDWAWQQEPDRILWIVLANGNLIAATIEREQQVLAWHRHPTQGFVEAVQVIPSPNGTRDDVWLIVRRQMVDGSYKRFVEYIDQGDDGAATAEGCFFLDCGLTYNGTAATTISGLGHLAGLTVQALADGGVHPPVVVSSGGTIQLNHAYELVQVGLPMRSVAVPMPIVTGGGRGTSQGKTTRIVQLGIRFHRTIGAKIGPSLTKLSPIAFRKPSDGFGNAPALFSGVVDVPFEGEYAREGTVCIVQDQPLPMTICALHPEMSVNERG